MSDQSLRDAERRWAETGSVDDEVRVLVERVRHGMLLRERLEFAAACGHEAAARALHALSPAPASVVSRWMRGVTHLFRSSTEFGGLLRFGQPVVVRAAVAAARLAPVPGAVAPAADVRGATSEALRATEAWLACPCAEHAEAALAAAQRVHGHIHDRYAQEGAIAADSLQWVASHALAAEAVQDVKQGELCVAAAVAARMIALGEDRRAATSAVWRGVAAALVGWALGDRHLDPPLRAAGGG